MKLNPNIAIVVGLRAAAVGLAVAGQSSASRTVNALADGVEAGTAIDSHMQEVADKLKAGGSTDADWDDAEARIRAASADIQSG